MQNLDMQAVQAYVEENIGGFHQKRLESIQKLRLKDILRKKNPYLYRAKYVTTSEQLIRSIADAFVSSSEEGIFGNWLEGLAIFINQQVYQGRKSGIEGIDLEFDKDGARYIVSIKSGPNWGNSSQVKKLLDNFKKAGRTLRTSNAMLKVVAVNGCCYGKDEHPDKGDYHKLCGARFWEFISGDESLYLRLITPLGYLARQRNEEFQEAYARLINRFTLEFSTDFCDPSGAIDWEKLVKYNSGR